MDCSACQGRSKVTSSQKSSEGVKRVRECILCGGRWSTREMFHVKLKVVSKPKPKPRVRAKLQAKPPRVRKGSKKKKRSAYVYTRSLLDRDDLDFDDDWR